MYASLPAAIRADFSLLDLRDFLGVCQRSGVADLADDGTVLLRPADRARFRVSFV